MLLNPLVPVFRIMMWSLFELWLLFGIVELGEQAHLIPENAEEDQAADQDEDALVQLASGLKSNILTLVPVLVAEAGPGPTSLITTFSCAPTIRPPRDHSPPSLRLHQIISVYRI